MLTSVTDPPKAFQIHQAGLIPRAYVQTYVVHPCWGLRKKPTVEGANSGGPARPGWLGAHAATDLPRESQRVGFTTSEWTTLLHWSRRSGVYPRPLLAPPGLPWWPRRPSRRWSRSQHAPSPSRPHPGTGSSESAMPGVTGPRAQGAAPAAAGGPRHPESHNLRGCRETFEAPRPFSRRQSPRRQWLGRRQGQPCRTASRALPRSQSRWGSDEYAMNNVNSLTHLI